MPLVTVGMTDIWISDHGSRSVRRPRTIVNDRQVDNLLPRPPYGDIPEAQDVYSKRSCPRGVLVRRDSFSLRFEPLTSALQAVAVAGQFANTRGPRRAAYPGSLPGHSEGESRPLWPTLPDVARYIDEQTSAARSTRRRIQRPGWYSLQADPIPFLEPISSPWLSQGSRSSRRTRGGRDRGETPWLSRVPWSDRLHYQGQSTRSPRALRPVRREAHRRPVIQPVPFRPDLGSWLSAVSGWVRQGRGKGRSVGFLSLREVPPPFLPGLAGGVTRARRMLPPGHSAWSGPAISPVLVSVFRLGNWPGQAIRPAHRPGVRPWTLHIAPAIVGEGLPLSLLRFTQDARPFRQAPRPGRSTSSLQALYLVSISDALLSATGYLAGALQPQPARMPWRARSGQVWPGVRPEPRLGRVIPPVPAQTSSRTVRVARRRPQPLPSAPWLTTSIISVAGPYHLSAWDVWSAGVEAGQVETP